MMASLRLALVAVFVSSPAFAAPTPPTDPCALAAFNELAAVQARITALAGSGATLADKLELAMDLPTSYVMQSPGADRFRDLFAAADAKATIAILTDMARDLDNVLADGRAWSYRCAAYPTWHVVPKPLDRPALAARRAIAKRAVASGNRADDCAKLQSKVLALPDRKRFAHSSALDRCYVDIEAARTQCERDFATIIHTDAFAPYRVSIAVSNLIELRRVHTISSADVAALRARVEPMLDALQPPLSSFAAPSRKALAHQDAVAVLYGLSGTLKQLYSPCERFWYSESRCIVRPESCRKRPN